MRQLLRPTSAKVLVALGLFALASWLWRIVVTSTIGDVFPWGFPFGFYETWGPCKPGDTCEQWTFRYFWVDLMLWYLASAALLGRRGMRA
jgi:hypothetical protein